MSTYLTLSHIQIQNANCVNGLTFGFPAVTHFLGYVHALSRKLEQSHAITLGGCAIICHKHQVHAYQPKGYGEYIFALTRNPLTKGGKTAPIIQEGKMHLTVSLLIECKGLIEGGEEGVKALQQHLRQICLTQKLAGGVINQIRSITIESANNESEQTNLTYKIRHRTYKIRHRLLPGFVLLDRSQYLEKHLSVLQEKNPNAEMLDAWLDFSTLKFKAEPLLDADETLSEKTKANWHYIPKPESGYLIPITIGYRAISKVFETGKIAGARDFKTPLCFVEAAYGLGEWQSAHRLQDIDEALWHYDPEEGWYLCSNQTTIDRYTAVHEDDNFDFID